ncbi:hypothetical protein BO78DRAFT_96321 [Aspergillus sclerotiicarbonarius CBS 121057]|uniref:Uncharacterized protein n=1 Tax=Aspergillus sclerotiicarbonarius (strain CBS 121057 / IBT 28362) TaxID=1448318 RepID=A0A319FN74_ASPSB|nr:hypothetical protein BO78DRAFT_96321 [Aspergillus sclerotiicarbonarius CBS 121057]
MPDEDRACEETRSTWSQSHSQSQHSGRNPGEGKKGRGGGYWEMGPSSDGVMALPKLLGRSPTSDAFHLYIRSFPHQDPIAPSSLYNLRSTCLVYLYEPSQRPFLHRLPTPRRGLRLGSAAGPSVWRCSLPYPPTSSDGALHLQHVPGHPCRLFSVQNLPPSKDPV